MEAFIVLTTCPDADTAGTLARTVVRESLCACVNILGPLKSVFRWKGEIQEASEYLLLLKTGASQWPVLKERLKALHPYELPEILAVSVADGLPAYLHWLTHPLSE